MKGKIFNAQEVQAIIAGNKTMFREVIKVQPDNDRQQFSTIVSSTMRGESGKHRFVEVENLNIATHTKYFKCPYKVGQEIFVKESFTMLEVENESYLPDEKVVVYKDTIDLGNDLNWIECWKPAQHMKQEHSRITLRITNIGVERLQDIREEDCLKEGLNPNTITNINNYFRNLWNATHKKHEQKWEINPWVWVIEFEINK